MLLQQASHTPSFGGFGFTMISVNTPSVMDSWANAQIQIFGIITWESECRNAFSAAETQSVIWTRRFDCLP